MLGHTSMHARNYAKPQIGDLVKIGSLDARAVVWVQEAHDTGEVMLVCVNKENGKACSPPDLIINRIKEKLK